MLIGMQLFLCDILIIMYYSEALKLMYQHLHLQYSNLLMEKDEHSAMDMSLIEQQSVLVMHECPLIQEKTEAVLLHSCSYWVI